MLIQLVVWPSLVAAATVIGPYSGIDLDHITDTPLLTGDVIVGATGEQLLEYGQGMNLQEVDGDTVVVTQSGFLVEFQVELDAGEYRLAVHARGTNPGNDSFWAELDDQRIDIPFTIPRSAIGERAMTLSVQEKGPHRVRLVLREGSGSILKSVQLLTAGVKPPRPPMRPQLLGNHPRILITADDVDALRARLEDERVREFYRLPGPLTREPPPFQEGKRNGGQFRGLGSRALGYLLAPNEEALAGILAWLDIATTYPHCGVDLDAEYFIEGIALTYDWLYEYIPEDLRVRVRDTIARQCRALFKASLDGRTGGGLCFQQNHYWFAHLSLALGAAAVCGEVPESEQWLAWAWDRYERIALSFGPDGGFHEGPSYWDFSMPTLYLYTDLYEWCTGLRAPALDRGLAGQAQFRLHHMFPGLDIGVPLEDTRIPSRRPPTKLLLWEAKRFQDPAAMGIAKLLNNGPSTDRFNLLWLDETLEATDTRQAAPAKHYPDIETVFARTSWDDDATHAAFICRPMGGHMYARLCEQFGIGGTGHNHPEQNHFTLFARGELLADDPGYTYEKLTRNHNTILVDGKGQYGDGEMWPPPNPGRAHITHFAAEDDVMIVTGDATSAYPPELGLTGFQRTFVLAGRDLAVVYDRLATDQPRTFTWLLHHRGETSEGDARWTIVRNDAQLTVAPLLPESPEAQTTAYTPNYIHPTRDLTPEHADLNLLELQTGPATDATFLVPLLIADAGADVPHAQLIQGNGCDAVRVGDVLVAFNRGDGEMTVTLPWGEELTTDARAIVARARDGDRQVVTCP